MSGKAGVRDDTTRMTVFLSYARADQGTAPAPPSRRFAP